MTVSTEKLAAFPGALAVHLGPLVVALLPPEAPLSDDLMPSLLLPGEAAHAAKFGSSARRDEFCRSRALIRHLTGVKQPLIPRATGELPWPEGVVGSLTHKDGLVGVALAPRGQFTSIGLDAEQLHRVHPGLEAKILTASDQAMLQSKNQERPGTFAAVAFSFKEALFKAHFPLGQRMFWFHDAEIAWLTCDPGSDSGRIAARVLVDTSPQTPRGSVTDGYFRLLNTSRGEIALTLALVP